MHRPPHHPGFLAIWTLLLTVLLGGCAQVAYQHGASALTEKSLLFGRVVLDREGEKSVISTFSTPVVIRNIETADEPGLVTQSFEKDGSFYWAMPPGRYQVSFVLTPYADGIPSFAFTLAKPGAAYYFGDMTFSGKKRFRTLGAANITDIETHLEDRLDQAKMYLLQKNPQLQSAPVEKLALRNMADPRERTTVYGDALSAKKPCCQGLAQLPYKRLAGAASSSEKIGADSDVFDFPAGRSRFVAWELPRMPGPYTITLRSLVTPSGLFGGRFYIFSLAVMLLDDEFNVISNQEQGVFKAVPASLIPPQSASLQADIPISGQTAQAKYLILYTTPSIIEGRWRTSMPGIMPIAGGVLPTGGALPVTMEPAISGIVEVKINPL